MLLNGCSVNSEGVLAESQATLTISQLIYFNTKVSCRGSEKLYHCKDREPPLPLYIGLSTHTHTRSKKAIESLYKLGISVSYSRMLEVEESIASGICKRYKHEDLVCPANLRKGLFTVGALDNIDHNPSATTAQGSFHGTAISIFQFPTQANPGILREPIEIEPFTSSKLYLPESYTNVPAVSCKTDQIAVSKCPCDLSSSESTIEAAQSGEAEWTEHALHLLCKESLEKGDNISWAAFHASLSPTRDDLVINAMLPLFHEKAATIAMIKHGMDVQLSIVNHLNPGQIAVMAFDQPLFALAKFVQWSWPQTYGEQHFIVMFGGLHVEMHGIVEYFGRLS